MPRSRPPCPDLARDAGEALPGFDAGLGRDTRARDARASESQHAGAAGRRRRRQGHASWRRFEARPAPRRPKRRARPAARPASASVCPQRERRRRAPVAGRCRWPASSLGWRRTSRRATRRRRFRRAACATRRRKLPPPPPPPPARLRFRSNGWAEWSAKPPLRKQARDAESGAMEGGRAGTQTGEARSWHATDVHAFLNTNPHACTPALAKSLCSPPTVQPPPLALQRALPDHHCQPLPPPPHQLCSARSVPPTHKLVQVYKNALSAVSPAHAPSLDHYPFLPCRCVDPPYETTPIACCIIKTVLFAACEWGLCGAAGRAGGVRQVLRSGSRQGPGCGRATA